MNFIEFNENTICDKNALKTESKTLQDLNHDNFIDKLDQIGFSLAPELDLNYSKYYISFNLIIELYED